MSSINKKQTITNHEQLPVDKGSALAQLKRLTYANLLWQDQFYVDGKTPADLIQQLVPQVPSETVAKLMLDVRSRFNLRHVPLLLAKSLARSGDLNQNDLAQLIQRPDELGEFLALYWQEHRQPLSRQVKRGLAKAFGKFNEYQLAKWDKNSAAVRVRDVMFLCHPKPRNPEQAALFKRIADNKMTVPDTWETALSSGKNKQETFTRLLKENKLGALAFIRNLRNMVNSGVDESLIRSYANRVDVSKVLPFRFITAYREVPKLADMLEAMMFKALKTADKLPGKTVLLVDVSGSMFYKAINSKEMDRFDAAAALAMLCSEVCEQVEVYTFSDDLVRVDHVANKGFALAEALSSSQSHGGTKLGFALNKLKMLQQEPSDRVIVFTDEQSWDPVPDPEAGTRGYLINVASYQNGISNQSWLEITGFSEAVIDFIREGEAENLF